MADMNRVRIEKKNRCGLIVLDRPERLNALDRDMLLAMESARRAWAEDLDIYGVVTRSSNPAQFCSGGDLKAYYEAWRRGATEDLKDFYRTEYQHCWTLDRFVKPSVTLIDGTLMGGGLGISYHGTHRVGGENLRFAMPECRIGFFPDVGATRFLSRMPGKLGLYLALTGRAVGQADAYYLEIISHCAPASRFDEIEEALSEAEPVDTVLKHLHVDPGPAPLEALRPLIDRTFSAGSVEEVLTRLDRVQGPDRRWAEGVATDIRANRPLSVKVAFAQLARGPDIALDDALRLEYRLADQFIEDDQFFEGIRAAVIDKDRKPVWAPADIAEIADSDVEALFAEGSRPGLHLIYPFRAAII